VIHGPEEPVYTIGVMARLLGCSTQVLRTWEREGLITPYRTSTNNRLYSANDYHRLVRILELTRQGVNLAGIRAILELEQGTPAGRKVGEKHGQSRGD
jgi:MerR family transcriptional regulator/heat shock protein HspR